jgi:hypothetical protein
MKKKTEEEKLMLLKKAEYLKQLEHNFSLIQLANI